MKKPKVITARFRFTEAERDKLQKVAAKDDRSINQWIAHLVRLRLQKTTFDDPKKLESG